MTIVGVVEEARHWRAERGQQPEHFMHYERRLESLSSQVVLFEVDGPPSVAYRAFEQSLASIDADVPVRFVPLSQEMARSVSRERLALWYWPPSLS